MTYNFFKFSTLTVTAALGLGLMVSGCSDDGGKTTPYPFGPAPTPTPTPTPAGTLKFDFNLLDAKADVPLAVKTFNFTLMAGEEVSLEDYQVAKDDTLLGSTQTVEIADVAEDVDSAIVTYLDENGKVLAADIVAVEVGSAEAYEPEYNAVSAIEFVPEEVTVAVGKKAEFVATLVCGGVEDGGDDEGGDEGGDEGDDEVSGEADDAVVVEVALDELENWASEDEAIATADGGVVTGVAEGETNVTAEYTNADGTLGATLSVIVTGDTPVSDYKIVDAGELGLEDGGTVMFLNEENTLSDDWATDALNTFYVNEVTLKVEAAVGGDEEAEPEADDDEEGIGSGDNGDGEDGEDGEGADEGGDDQGDEGGDETTGEDITWNWSTEADYMTVDENGVVTITGAGEGGKIVATNADDETQTVEFAINATEVAPKLHILDSDGNDITDSEIQVEVASETQLYSEAWYEPVRTAEEAAGEEDSGEGDDPAGEVKFGPFITDDFAFSGGSEYVVADPDGLVTVANDEAAVGSTAVIEARASVSTTGEELVAETTFKVTDAL